MAPSSQASDRRRSNPPSVNLPDLQPKMQARMPPGATGSRNAATSGVNNYARMTEEALLNASSRESQPHLHPMKLNGALWFGIDPSVHKFIRATWQGNFMGPWRCWSSVSDYKITQWWQTFMQNYYWEPQFHSLVHARWKKQTQKTICGRISKKKREGKKPKYINDEQWTSLLEYWDTEKAKKNSASAAKSRTSDPTGKGMSKHCAGPQNFAKIEYDLKVASGEPPSFIELVRKTHTKKDGTFMDPRSQSIVEEVEEAVSQITNAGGSPNSESPIPTRILLNQEYIKRGKTRRGGIYGIGSVQYQDCDPSETAAASVERHVEMDMRVSGLESKSEAINNNVEGLKTDVTTLKENIVALKDQFKDEMNATRASLNAILQILGSNPHANHAQPRAPAAPSTTSRVLKRRRSDTTPVPAYNEAQESDLDRWCAELD